MSKWNSIRGKSNRMINVTFVVIIKFIKVGRVWSPFDWYLLQSHPCPIQLYAPLHLFAGANHTKQFTAVPKYDVVFSLCGHPPDISSSNSFAASTGMYLWTDLLLWLWVTDRLFRYIYLSSSPKFANHRYDKGVRGSMVMSGGLCDHLGFWLILVSGWHVITLAVNQDRHREPDMERLRRAATEGSRQLWGDLKQCGDWDIIYWYRPAVVALKTFSIIFEFLRSR